MFPLAVVAPTLAKVIPLLVTAIGAGVAVAMSRKHEVVFEIEKQSPDGKRFRLRAEYRQKNERRRGR